ncbi:MAG: 7-cyano-7-deazaguanine synthase QueC [Deltaproteobacteria bacterium]|nr:7-cyano-7-deazaguanine synthase QueC [Deltaproteobacteria bacterium]
MKKVDKAIILLSGGMDSATVLAMASRKYNLIALHFNYHQRTEKKELWCFHQLCQYYNVEKKIIIDLDFFRKIGGSTLLRGIGKVPKPRFRRDKIPSTYVPFRNGIMLSIATAVADRFSARYIFLGAVEADFSGYPDCRYNFIKNFEKAAKVGTKNQNISIVAPLLNLTKSQIVSKGIKLGVPYQYTWSCYNSNDKPCLKCESCLLRLKGFDKAGYRDPLLV